MIIPENDRLKIDFKAQVLESHPKCFGQCLASSFVLGVTWNGCEVHIIRTCGYCDTGVCLLEHHGTVACAA